MKKQIFGPLRWNTIFTHFYILALGSSSERFFVRGGDNQNSTLPPPTPSVLFPWNLDTCSGYQRLHKYFFLQGNVYVKCPNIACAVAAVNALHGRWFAGMTFFKN